MTVDSKSTKVWSKIFHRECFGKFSCLVACPDAIDCRTKTVRRIERRRKHDLTKAESIHKAILRKAST